MVQKTGQAKPSPTFFADENGVVGVKLEDPATFGVMCAVMLNPLIAYGLDSAVVACHMLCSLERVADTLSSPEYATQLTSYVERIRDVSQTLLKDERESAAVQREAEIVISALARVALHTLSRRDD